MVLRFHLEKIRRNKYHPHSKKKLRMCNQRKAKIKTAAVHKTRHKLRVEVHLVAGETFHQQRKEVL